MKKLDESQPAFPVPGDQTRSRMIGMSLRDAFAISALQGILAGYWSNTAMGDLAPDAIADEAYQHADAMIAARKGGGRHG